MNLDDQLAQTDPPSEALDKHRLGVLRGATGRTETFGKAQEQQGTALVPLRLSQSC